MNTQFRKQKQSEIIDKLQQQLEAIVNSEDPDYARIESIANSIKILASSIADLANTF